MTFNDGGQIYTGTTRSSGGRAGRRIAFGASGGVRTELRADCYAGIWTHYAAVTQHGGLPDRRSATVRHVRDQ